MTYFNQMDSSYDPDRSCLTACIAMKLAHMEFDIKHINDYGKLVKKYTDDPTVVGYHLMALKDYFGIHAYHFDNCNKFTFNQIISIKNRGPSNSPYGLGHWILVRCFIHNPACFIVDDPFGHLNYYTGIYICKNGHQLFNKEDLYNRWDGQVICF